MNASDIDMKQFSRVLKFAASKHRDQRRKDQESSPYINHPIDLLSVLSFEAGITDQVVLSAAILHDTVEDTETTETELIEHFGTEVAAIVMEVTDDKTLCKQDRKRLQIEKSPHVSDSAKLVKLADKICNLRDLAVSPPYNWSVERQQEYYDWAERVVAGLRGSHSRLESLFDQAMKTRPDNL